MLLERASFDDLEDSEPPGERIGRVWLVAEPEIGAAFSALRASGVHGVLPIWASANEIEAAIAAAAAGLVVLHPDMVEQLPEAPSRTSGASSGAFPGQALSRRESEILSLLAAGLANKEVAARLKISEHTVKFHVTSIFNKLGASSRTEAVAIGMRRGLIVL